MRTRFGFRTVREGLCVGGAALVLGACTTITTGGPQFKPQPRQAAHDNTELAVGYLRQGDDDRARAALLRAIQEDDDYAPAHGVLAQLEARSGQNEAAAASFRTALRLDPRSAATLNNYGVFLCSTGHPEQAQDAFRKALADPGYATPAAAWTNAGVCAQTQRRGDEAETDFRTALRADPRFVPALDALANALYARGAYADALDAETRMDALQTPGPAELLREMRTLRALGETARANALMQRLVQQFPQSRQARDAIKNLNDASTRDVGNDTGAGRP